jgi:hypothetical protein
MLHVTTSSVQAFFDGRPPERGRQTLTSVIFQKKSLKPMPNGDGQLLIL